MNLPGRLPVIHLQTTLCCIFLLGACTHRAAPSGIEQTLATLGFRAEYAACTATELARRLDRHEINELAGHIARLDRAASPGQALDTLLQIDNPRFATAIGASMFRCTKEYAVSFSERKTS